MSIRILEETLSFLRISCIWPKKGHELNPGKWYYVKFVALSLANSVVLIGSVLHLIVSIRHNVLDSVSEDLVMIVGEVGVYYFQSVFVWYGKEIAGIYMDLSNFDKFGVPQNFHKLRRDFQFLSKWFKNYIDLSLFFFYIWPFFTKKHCEKHNEQNEWKDVCGLIAPSWMPFNIEDVPYHQIFYIWQCYSQLFILKGGACISFAMMESIEYLVVKIQHLKSLLDKAISTKDKKKRHKLLVLCVQYHNHVFDIGSRIDKCYTGCLFGMMLVSGALFGCIMYKVRHGFALNFVCFFVGWFISLYIVCMGGQHLINEATSIAEMAYHGKWYDRDASFQKNITFIILRSRRPIVVHAGPFSYVSHMMILSILKTAYSYMTLLNTAV